MERKVVDWTGELILVALLSIRVVPEMSIARDDDGETLSALETERESWKSVGAANDGVDGDGLGLAAVSGSIVIAVSDQGLPTTNKKSRK